MFDKKVSGRIRYNTVYGEGDLKKILEEEKEAVLKHFEANKKGDGRLCEQSRYRIEERMESVMSARRMENERKRSQNELAKREAMIVGERVRNDG